jgi:hypothetical protein
VNIAIVAAATATPTVTKVLAKCSDSREFHRYTIGNEPTTRSRDAITRYVYVFMDRLEAGAGEQLQPTATTG